MPSPFPGMDPFLEASLRGSVHAQLSAEIARQLAPVLSPRYVALTMERFVLDEPDGVSVSTTSLYPDVAVAKSGELPISGHATAVAAAPLRLATVVPVRASQVFVEIRDTAKRRLVTVIEVLSRSNKRLPGRREYLARRQRILLSPVHLMEIDLLRGGRRVPMRQPLPVVPYFVLLSRAQNRPVTDVWPIRLQDPLPVVPVPLLPNDDDIPLDLQVAFASIYDLLRFDLSVDYEAPLEPPLDTEDSAWVQARLHALRSRL